MRHYNNIQPLWMSFYAGELYEDAGRNWKGTGFAYVFFLIAVTWIPLVFTLSNRFDSWVDRHLPGIIEEAPEMKIEDGKLSTDPNKPFIIDDPSTGKLFMIIDVTGRYTSLEGTEARILVMEDSFLLMQDDGEIQRVPVFQDVDETVVFNKDTLYQIFDFFKTSLPFFLYPSAVVMSVIYWIVQVCIFAGIGIYFAQYLNTKMSYETLLRLAAISITPAVILDTVHILIDASLPYWWFICLLLSMGYLYFAVKVNGLAETEALAARHEEEMS